MLEPSYNGNKFNKNMEEVKFYNRDIQHPSHIGMNVKFIPCKRYVIYHSYA